MQQVTVYGVCGPVSQKDSSEVETKQKVTVYEIRDPVSQEDKIVTEQEFYDRYEETIIIEVKKNVQAIYDWVDNGKKKRTIQFNSIKDLIQCKDMQVQCIAKVQDKSLLPPVNPIYRSPDDVLQQRWQIHGPKLPILGQKKLEDAWHKIETKMTQTSDIHQLNFLADEALRNGYLDMKKFNEIKKSACKDDALFNLALFILSWI